MFFTRFIKPFLIIGGLITMLASVYAIDAAWALDTMNGLGYDSQYVFLFRHWGIMVGLMGFFIIASAYKIEWRGPIILYSFLEKLFMVYLYVSNYFNPELSWLNERFIPFALTDMFITIYTLGYWYELYKSKK